MDVFDKKKAKTQQIAKQTDSFGLSKMTRGCKSHNIFIHQNAKTKENPTEKKKKKKKKKGKQKDATR